TSNNNENVIEEGKFQIDHLLKHASVIDCRYGFMSEDSTGVIRKIEYDSVTNAFIGFSTPLIAGLPSCKHFQIDAFDELKNWFSTYEKAQLLNVHMFQPITTNSALSSPYLFSTYGTSSKFTPNDIWCRWILFNNIILSVLDCCLSHTGLMSKIYQDEHEQTNDEDAKAYNEEDNNNYNTSTDSPALYSQKLEIAKYICQANLDKTKTNQLLTLLNLVHDQRQLPPSSSIDLWDKLNIKFEYTKIEYCTSCTLEINESSCLCNSTNKPISSELIIFPTVKEIERIVNNNYDLMLNSKLQKDNNLDDIVMGILHCCLFF
ncbi:unnamed protein product, partial [Didymodactylos carnosus]